MAPPRRVRDESLVLRRPGGEERVLGRRRVTGYGFEPFPSQRRFQVSADARALAFTVSEGGEAHLLRSGGADRIVATAAGDVRFAPDRPTLALVRIETDASRRVERVVRVDLAGGEPEPWAEVQNCRQIEHGREGLVVLQTGPEGRSSALTLLPWSGPPRHLVGPANIERFVVAKGGSRIVYFTRDGIYATDVGATRPGGAGEAEGTRLADLPRFETATNAEMSPDGERVVYATRSAVFSLGGDGPPVVEATEPEVHTIWFSPDGAAFAWASPAGATRRAHGETQRLDAPARDLSAMRFIRLGVGLLVCRGRDLLVWSGDRKQPIATVAEDTLLLGADLFTGGLVLWSGTRWAPPNGEPTNAVLPGRD